jgi:hypothetical protein
MSKRISGVLAVAVLAANWAMLGNAAEERQTLPKPPDKQTLRAEEVKQLLLLMDTDKNGKISKQEWLKCVEVEFDRLDKNKSGMLDIKTIAPSALRARHSADLGK